MELALDQGTGMRCRGGSTSVGREHGEGTAGAHGSLGLEQGG